MKKKLKIIKSFEPCPVDDGDEMYPNGIFVFNITKMAEFIQNQNVASEEVKVRDYSRGSSKWKEDHVEMVDVTKPVIVAEISPGRYNVIDGNHRMEKARRLGLEKIQAYKLSPEQHLQFLTTEKGYLSYIEYWNGKLKDAKRYERQANPKVHLGANPKQCQIAQHPSRIAQKTTKIAS